MTVLAAASSPYRPAAARIAPFAAFMVLLAAAPAAAALAPGWDTRWLDIGRAAAAAALLAWFWREYAELRAGPRMAAREALAAVAWGLAVFAVWIVFDEGWAVSGGGPGFDPTGPDGRVDRTLALLRLAGMVLVVPVMEELFWRSWVLRWLEDRDFLSVDPSRVRCFSIVVTAVLFASEHSLWFAGVIAGLTYNGLYVRTKKLWVAVLAHATTNAALGAWILLTGDWKLW